MKVRPATYDDLPEIKMVCSRNSLGTNVINPEIWKSYPAIKRYEKSPIGWVMENEEKKIVGTLSNIFMNYEFNGEVYKAAIASSWAADEEYRSKSISLIRSFINQKNIDILLTSTASEKVGKIWKAFKFSPVPCVDYKQVMFWVIDYPGLIGSLIKRKTELSVESQTFNFISGKVLEYYDFFIKRNKYFGVSKDVIEVKSFDHKFDDFFYKLQTTNKITAERSSAVLRWHYERAIKEQKITVLALYQGGGLNGYIVIMRADNNKIGLKRLQIVDLQILQGFEYNIDALMSGAIEYAHKQQVHILELIGFGDGVRRQLSKSNPYIRHFTHCPFYFKLKNESLGDILPEDIEWDASLYDGDGSLF